MLPVPLGGAVENVRVLPATPYVLGSCKTPLTATNTFDTPAGATDIVNAVVEPLPLNWSVTKADWYMGFPMYGIVKLSDIYFLWLEFGLSMRHTRRGKAYLVDL